MILLTLNLFHKKHVIMVGNYRGHFFAIAKLFGILAIGEQNTHSIKGRIQKTQF